MSSAEVLTPSSRLDFPLAVSEIFGPTWQGEGPSLGRLCSFIRLSGCNLHCSWCDTPYTWDWTGRNGQKYDVQNEVHAMTVGKILKQMAPLLAEMNDRPMFVISGGEPMLQDKGIQALIEEAKTQTSEHAVRYEIETNGTKIPCFRSDLVDQYNVSPKLSGSDNFRADALNFESLGWYALTRRAIFKFVVSHLDEFQEIRELQQRLKLDPSDIWIMPQGINHGEIIWNGQRIAPTVLSHGYNLTTRLHVLLFGNRRGV